MPLEKSNDLRKVSYTHFTTDDEIEWRIDHFSDYLEGNSVSPLEESIASSIRWYRYANRSPEREEEFLKYIIAMESLLVKDKSESKANNIAERAVTILHFHNEYRRDYNEFFREVYDVRNQIVHSGARNLPEFEKQLDELEKFLSQLIITAQDYTDECDSVTELIGKIETEEQELREERKAKSPFDTGESFSIEANLREEGGPQISKIHVDGQFKDDGRYVYYEGEITNGEYCSDGSVSSNNNYEVRFEVEDDWYIGSDIAFPESTLVEKFPEEHPEIIRWYAMSEV